MKTVLLITFLLMAANVALADTFVIADDSSGSSCQLHYNPACFTCEYSQYFILHKFSTGATGCLLKLELAPGSTVYEVQNSPGSHGIDTAGTYISYGGPCAGGTIALVTFGAVLGPGEQKVVAAVGEASPVYYDCIGNPHAATGDTSYYQVPGPCTVATEPSTWGAVKALYR